VGRFSISGLEGVQSLEDAVLVVERVSKRHELLVRSLGTVGPAHHHLAEMIEDRSRLELELVAENLRRLDLLDPDIVDAGSVLGILPELGLEDHPATIPVQSPVVDVVGRNRILLAVVPPEGQLDRLGGFHGREDVALHIAVRGQEETEQLALAVLEAQASPAASMIDEHPVVERPKRCVFEQGLDGHHAELDQLEELLVGHRHRLKEQVQTGRIGHTLSLSNEHQKVTTKPKKRKDRLLGGLFDCGDIYLFHLQHGIHHSSCLCLVRIGH
jgi:hypothetical protein